MPLFISATQTNPAPTAVKTEPIVPARLELNPQGLPFSSAFGDVYHPRAGAFAQAEHVFLAGNGLPQRWDDRLHNGVTAGAQVQRFVVLETGFGLGNNFLATWTCWKRWRARLSEAERNALELEFVSIELHPFTRPDMAQAHAQSPCPEMAQQLLSQWPPLTPNLHTLRFEHDALTLRLALGSARLWLRELVMEADALYLDGFAPARNPQLWEPGVFKALARLAAPGASLATWSAARAVRDGLRSAGFNVQKAPGSGGKRDITLAQYAPRHSRPSALRSRGQLNTDRGAQPMDERQWLQRAALRLEAGMQPPSKPDVWVVGAGLAGCSIAWTLASQGLRVGLLDAGPEPAGGASGNPAGLFHGVVHGEDAPHARLHRAAALQASALATEAIQAWHVPGALSGLLRLAPEASADELRELLARSGLPAEYVHAVSQSDAARISAWPLHAPGWLFPGGGWLNPAQLCRAFVHQAGPGVQFRGGVSVARLRRQEDVWQLLDTQDLLLGEAPQVVLANAGAAETLLREVWANSPPGCALPPRQLMPTRGQISWLGDPGASTPPLTAPCLPIAGQGYAIAAHDGNPAGAGYRLVFGASSTPGVDEPRLEPTDHSANWQKLMQLVGPSENAWPMPPGVSGRAGVRWSPNDRLPWVGAAPDWQAVAGATDSQRQGWEQVRRIPRLPGLFLHAALGSRGLTWCALTSQLLAAQMLGRTWPLEASLADALDPARSISREIRRAE